MIMLTDLKKHKSYSSMSSIKILLSFLKENICDKHQIKSYFNENLDIISNIDDTISLLVLAEIVRVNNSNKYTVQKNEQDSPYIVKKILRALHKKNIFVFNEDEQGCSLFISHHYYPIRNFLISSNVIAPEGRSIYKVQKNFENIARNAMKKPVSLDRLKKDLVRKEELGNKAELYVLEYEAGKFPDRRIDYISPIDVSAGYDIKSYLDNNSSAFDKFIEVKCISERDIFYWSKNEIQTAEQLGENYYLYFVKSSFDTIPIEVKNPYKKIFLNKELSYLTETVSYNFEQICEFLKKKSN